MSDKERRKKDGQDKNKKNQARREKERKGNTQPLGSSPSQAGKKKTSGQQGARGGRKSGGAQRLG
jgi:hypothetical protein